MRKVDKIKQLEGALRKAQSDHMKLHHELGRYQKAVVDRDKKIAALRAEYQGYREIQLVLDAIIAYLVARLATDRRLEIPVEGIRDVMGKYQVAATKSVEKQAYVLEICERAVKNENAENPQTQ